MDRVRSFAALCCLGLLGGLPAAAPAPQPAQPAATFRAAVELVPINAVVRDRRGHVVTTLTQSDFAVFDKGERRRILDFQIDRTSPVTLALLLDVSGSMRLGPRLALARGILGRVVGDLRDGRDAVGLFSFDSDWHEDHPFTVHPAAVDATFRRAQPFGTTSLYDAIAATARRFEGRPLGRRAIVVFTDGLDTSSRMTAREVSGLASSIDVPVYVVVTVSSFDQAQQIEHEPTDPWRPTADLRDLAQWTGGDLLWAADPGLDPARQILAELRQQYLMAIEASREREWRRLDVRVRDPRLTVRARGGYFSR